MSFALSLGHGIVTGFQSIRESPFLNAEIDNAPPLEKLGNFFLIPSRYLFMGKTVVNIQTSSFKNLSKYQIEQCYKYDYSLLTLLKTVAAVIALLPSLIIGCALKGLAFISAETRKRHAEYCAYLNSGGDIAPKNEVYESVGIVQLFSDKTAPKYLPPPGVTIKKSQYENLTDYQKKQVNALKAVIEPLKSRQIPHWIDYGTCLGEFRNDGLFDWDKDVDIGIPQIEHDNVKRLLRNSLDPKLYEVQDWSSSLRPKTFLRVHIKATHALIDIYHYTLEGRPDCNEAFYPKNAFDSEIDPTAKKVQYVYSYHGSWLPGVEWQNKERSGCKPMPYATLFPLKKGIFNGIEVYVPNDIERWLKSKYGDDLSPKKNWDPIANEYI